MKLFVRDLGKGEPLIILHGLYGSSDNWLRVGKILSENFRVLLVDQRNHGRSPHSADHGYHNMSSDLHELLDDLGIDRAHLIGHSMGGKVATLFSKQFPARVKSLVVVDIAPKTGLADSPSTLSLTAEHKRIIAGLLSIPVQTITTREEAETILSLSIGNFEVRQFLLKNLKRMADGTFQWRLNLPVLGANLNSMMGDLELFPPEEKVGVRTLIVRGGLSAYVPDNVLEAIQSTFTNSTVITLPDVGHWLHVEKPLEFCEEVSRFIRG